ncbi:MAG TPA: enoyl-CoA hydratase/isomerase family protein [Allosphingosinicella sp.]|nr:enoyl-CoA hydratase/isomerase family protein [Allosphingosinicella sp.]
MFDLILDEAIARLRLDRPGARNAVPASGWARLARCCTEAAESGARLLVVAGNRDSFCAGADLDDFAAFVADPARATEFRTAMREGLDALRHVPIATIAAIEGPCYGAGVALAMACDLRIAGVGARFAITPAKFGISYPQEDVARLVALVGPGQASRLLLGAEPVDAAEAARMGLVEMDVVDVGAAVDGLARAILANDRDSVAVLKRAVRLASEGMSRDDRQDRDFDALFGSAAFRERLASLRRPG